VWPQLDLKAEEDVTTTLLYYRTSVSQVHVFCITLWIRSSSMCAIYSFEEKLLFDI
jgi:hypothetical protein